MSTFVSLLKYWKAPEAREVTPGDITRLVTLALCSAHGKGAPAISPCPLMVRLRLFAEPSTFQLRLECWPSVAALAALT
jgi:hypothetical protein